jgi:hypothetical protein
MTSRREFIQWLPVTTCGLALATQAGAQGALVDEKSPQAAGLGYVADAAKADKAKYKQYAAGQACANCALYKATAGAASGTCPLFQGKQVAAKGWCSAYAKKN